MPNFSNGAPAPDLIEILDLISEQAHSAKAMIELMRKASDCEDLSDTELTVGLDAIDANLHAITDNCSLTDINHPSPRAPLSPTDPYNDIYTSMLCALIEEQTGEEVDQDSIELAVGQWTDFVEQHSEAMRTPRRDAANNGNGGAA